MKKKLTIVVCIKQVRDQEAHSSFVEIDTKHLKVTAEGISQVLNPLDESALELALRIKDNHPGTKIIVVGTGNKMSDAIMIKSLAVGADELVLIDSQEMQLDTGTTPLVLAEAIKMFEFDLVLTGLQAADTNAGCTGLALSELLGIPAVSWARNIEIDDHGIIVERITADGFEVLKGLMPALVTVSFEAGTIRSAKVTAMRDARKKPIRYLSLGDLNLKLDSAYSCIQLEPSSNRVRKCKFLEGDSTEELAAKLKSTLIHQGFLEI